MLELVDEADSKSVAKWRPGSNPGCGTNRYAAISFHVFRWVDVIRVRLYTVGEEFPIHQIIAEPEPGTLEYFHVVAS